MIARRPTFATAVALGLVAATVMGAVALATVERGATVTEVAERVDPPVGDLAVVFDVGDVDAEVVAATDRVADRVGAIASVSRSGSLGMRRIVRGQQLVHGPPTGWLTPTVYVSLPRGSVGRVMGADVSAVLDADSVVMNEVNAELTGAQVGDVIEMQAAGGSVVALTISGIRPYDQIGWAELVFTFDVAQRLGATADTRAVVYGIDDRDAFDAAVRAEGLDTRRDTRVNRSWDAPSPDSTLSTARAKVALGEPWYRFTSPGVIETHPQWRATYLTDERVLLNDTIRIRARCHVEVVDDLRTALAEVEAAGLAAAIDVANANAFGGCYVPRFSRVSGQIGFLSRHTYGMALDTNTTSNCAGCRPQMDCDVVRIFRRNGFAWGGNFRRPDGMHFEWVGERRDQITYPSRYCPNLVTAQQPTEQFAATAPIGMGALVAGGDDMNHHHPHGS